MENNPKQERQREDPALTPGYSARPYALLSLVAAFATITLKFSAFRLTGSVSLFSDAVESVVNVVAAGAALWALSIAARPADEEHAHGHTKAEYLSSGLAAALILLAALGIGYASIQRLIDPQPLENVWLGLIIAGVAALVNGVVAVILLNAGRRLRSITLRADAQHLMTDVWTTAGVVAGVLLVEITGWLRLDPLVALLVTLNIIRTGLVLGKDTFDGILDASLPPEDVEEINGVLAKHEADGMLFHAVRTRASGQRRFISLHVLVPGEWSVQRGHDLCEQIEREIIEALPLSTVSTHLEPLEDPAAWQDQQLDRLRNE